ncbi:hypothetical protein [Negadavirga shengliensis]|uniref:Uncharacterized protein n=1 Tax=Negadavirga shengliensis TaxID=1389218 RepID=A0ABV9T2K7_9BACT
MKSSPYFPLTLIGFMFFSCQSPEKVPEGLPGQVSRAYGFDRLESVASISYTWNVRRDSVTVDTRDWSWDLEKGEVFYSGPDTAVTYLISEKTDALESVDKRFINDKYWLLFPFQLAWDTGYESEVIEDQNSPIHNERTTKLIIRYNDSDGYTPGDAYDLYIDDNNQIREWVFRRGDGPEGRAMTWENVQDFEGIKIALDHRNDAGEKTIWFTNVTVKQK